MKTSAVTLLLSFISLVALGQVDIALHRAGFFTLCVYNTFTVSSKKYVLKHFQLSTDNGTLEPSTTDGDYVIRPARPSIARIYVGRSQHKDTIARFQYEVRRMSPPSARFAGKTSGELRHIIAIVQKGIYAFQGSCMESSPVYVVTGYTVKTIRAGKTTFAKKLNDARFTEDVENRLTTLENGDVLRFEHISARDCDGEILSLQPIEFTIKDAVQLQLNDSPDTVLDTLEVIDPITSELTIKIFRLRKK